MVLKKVALTNPKQEWGLIIGPECERKGVEEKKKSKSPPLPFFYTSDCVGCLQKSPCSYKKYKLLWYEAKKHLVFLSSFKTTTTTGLSSSVKMFHLSSFLSSNWAGLQISKLLNCRQFQKEKIRILCDKILCTDLLTLLKRPLFLAFLTCFKLTQQSLELPVDF